MTQRPDVNRQIVLRQRPNGPPSSGDFAVVESKIPEPHEGQVLTRTLWLSLDPYMNVRIRSKSYAEPVAIGGVIVGHTVGRVIASRHPSFSEGDIVLGWGEGWQDYMVNVPERKLDPALAPLSTALGVLGMPGRTAYVGLLDIGKPKAGETVVVSSAAGTVGATAGQIAKQRGARVIGIAGGSDKCRYVKDELGFDLCLDYRAKDFAQALAAACPKGVDVYFENVGGDVQAAVWPLLNDFGRVIVCGLIAEYNNPEALAGPSLRSVLNKRLTVRGFIVSDAEHEGRTGDFLHDVSSWVREGKVRYREDVIEGLENAPEGLRALVEGKYLGKAVVHVADP